MKKIPTFDTPAPFELFLDLDGVFANFELRFFKMVGKWPHEVPKNHLWKVVNSVNDYFYKLELHDDAEHLWTYTKQYNPKFLTGLPMMANGKEQKQRWVAEKFGPEWETIVVPKREKQFYSGPNKVLVDDTIVNISQWVNKGGHGVHHSDVWKTIAQLEELRKAYII
jgi:hypothetical protein